MVAGSVVEGSAAGGCGGRGEGDRRGGAMPDNANLRAYASSADSSTGIATAGAGADVVVVARGGDMGGGANEKEAGGANWSVVYPVSSYPPR